MFEASLVGSARIGECGAAGDGGAAAAAAAAAAAVATCPLKRDWK
jgi:hypothetical protein